MILTTGCNTWNTGLDIVVEGDAVRISDQGGLERLASVWATKWDGRWIYEVRDGYFYHYDEEDHTILSHALLMGAILRQANLGGATLAEATLIRAHLVGATLRGATLTRANLTGPTSMEPRSRGPI